MLAHIQMVSYTQDLKKEAVKKILDLLVKHGANNDITIDAHPHIGTNKLPTIIRYNTNYYSFWGRGKFRL